MALDGQDHVQVDFFWSKLSDSKQEQQGKVNANISLDSYGNKINVSKTKKKSLKPNTNKIMTDTQETINKGISIKDLRLEDKKRVADLIKELAKITDHRDKLKKELVNQRQLFESRINEILNAKDESDEERIRLYNKYQDCLQQLKDLKLELASLQQLKDENLKTSVGVATSPSLWKKSPVKKEILINQQGNVRTKDPNYQQRQQTEQEINATNNSYENLIQLINQKLKLVNNLIAQQADKTYPGEKVANSSYALVNPSESKEFCLKDEINKEDNNIASNIEAINSNTNTQINNNAYDKNQENVASGNIKVNLIQLYRELKEQKKLLELQYFHLLQQEKDLSTMYEDFNATDDPSALATKENYIRNLSLQDYAHPLDNSNDHIQSSSSHDKEMVTSDRISVHNSRSESNKLPRLQNEYSIIDDHDQSIHYDVNPILKLTTDSILFKKPFDKSLTNHHLATSSDQVNIDQLQQRIIENQYLIRDYLRSLEKSIESSSTNILTESQDMKETSHKSLHSNTHQASAKDTLKYQNKLIPSRLSERNDVQIEQHNTDYSSQSGRDSPSKLRHSNVNLDDSDSDNLIDIALSQIKHRKQITNRDSEKSNLKDTKYDYDELSTGYISSPLSPKQAFRLNNNRLVFHEEGTSGQIRNWYAKENSERKGRVNASEFHRPKMSSFNTSLNHNIVKGQEDTMLEDVFFVQ